MNERIDNLFGQALDMAVPETWTTLDVDQLNRLKEKFAELIIQDCLFMISVKASQYIDPEWRDGLIDDIKEHFGVQSHIKQMEE